MAVVGSLKAGAGILKAMGFNPDQINQVRDFVVDFKNDDVITLSMKVYLSQEQIDALESAFKSYDVVLREREE